MSRIGEYLKDTKTEVKHIVWPSRGQIIIYTITVIALSILVGYYLGVFDFLFSKGLGELI